MESRKSLFHHVALALNPETTEREKGTTSVSSGKASASSVAEAWKQINALL